MQSNKRSRKKLLLGFETNHLINLIAFIAVVFIFFKFIYVIYRMTDLSEAQFRNSVYDYFILPSNLSTFFTKPWSIFTYMFMHFGVLHVLGNLLWLWAFGFIMQDLTGNGRVIPVFLYGGLAGGIFFMLAYNLFPALSPVSSVATLEGASAGAMAVAVATTMLAPGYRLLPMLNGGIPLWVVTLIFVVVDLATIPTSNPGGHIAHLAGALIGFLYVLEVRRGRDWGLWIINFFDWFSDLFNPKKGKKSAREKHFYKVGNTRPYEKVPNITQQRIDALLEKIHQKGYRSLSEEEKEILKRAAEDDNL